jgi:hypothetical protein
MAATLVIAGLAVWLYANNKRVSHVDASTPQVISGRVTSISNECRADGTCSMTLDGSKSIVTGCGLMANGKTCKSYDQSKLHAGQQVEATVTKGQSGWYNLECDSCTIRVIGN